MPKKDLVEKYGNPHLVWGYYPLSADYNSGGCMGTCGPAEIASDFDAARGESQSKSMVQRGGNNAFHFKQHPGYTQYVVGTGCYNNNCHSYNCNGDSLCDHKGNFMSHSPRDPIDTSMMKYAAQYNQYNEHSGMESQMDGMNDAFTWLGMIAVAYFIYKFLIRRR